MPSLPKARVDARLPSNHSPLGPGHSRSLKTSIDSTGRAIGVQGLIQAIGTYVDSRGYGSDTNWAHRQLHLAWSMTYNLHNTTTSVPPSSFNQWASMRETQLWTMSRSGLSRQTKPSMTTTLLVAISSLLGKPAWSGLFALTGGCCSARRSRWSRWERGSRTYFPPMACHSSPDSFPAPGPWSVRAGPPRTVGPCRCRQGGGPLYNLRGARPGGSASAHRDRDRVGLVGCDSTRNYGVGRIYRTPTFSQST